MNPDVTKTQMVQKIHKHTPILLPCFNDKHKGKTHKHTLISLQQSKNQNTSQQYNPHNSLIFPLAFNDFDLLQQAQREQLSHDHSWVNHTNKRNNMQRMTYNFYNPKTLFQDLDLTIKSLNFVEIPQ